MPPARSLTPQGTGGTQQAPSAPVATKKFRFKDGTIVDAVDQNQAIDKYLESKGIYKPTGPDPAYAVKRLEAQQNFSGEVTTPQPQDRPEIKPDPTVPPPAVNGLSAQQVIDAYKEIMGPSYSPSDSEIALGRAGYLTPDALKGYLKASKPPTTPQGPTKLTPSQIRLAYRNMGLEDAIPQDLTAITEDYTTAEDLNRYLTTLAGRKPTAGLNSVDILDAYVEILGRAPTTQELKDAMAIYPDIGRLRNVLTSLKPATPQGVQKLTEEDLKRIVTQDLPAFTPITTDLSKTGDLILEKQRGASEQFAREEDFRTQRLRDLMAGQRTEEANRIAQLGETTLPKFAQAQEPLLQQQLAGMKQSVAGNTMQAQEQLRKAYAASGRDVDLPQSGALTSTFGQIAGQGGAQLAQAEGGLRSQIQQAAQQQLRELIAAEGQRSTQERNILANEFAGQRQGAQQIFGETLQNIEGDIRTQQQQQFAGEQANLERQFREYQANLDRALQREVIAGKLSSEDKGSILSSIGSIAGSLATLGSGGTSGILSSILGTLGLRGSSNRNLTA